MIPADICISKIRSYLKKIKTPQLIDLIDSIIDDLSEKTAYFGVTEKTIEIIFSILHYKIMTITATHKQKISYILKKLNYIFNGINEDNIKLLKNILDRYFTKHKTLDDYIQIQNITQEAKSLQKYYDLIEGLL
jgi:hypothetical protein